MLKSIKLRNFRAFEQFTVSFRQKNYLVGPNSAGKSTILSVIRLTEACLRYIKSSSRPTPKRTQERTVYTFPIPLREFAALNESVRHNFREEETSFEVTWKNGSKLKAVWPINENGDDPAETLPYFYLTDHLDRSVRGKEAQDSFAKIGVIPTLSPMEHEEEILREKYVRSNLSSRRSSRHVRNQLHFLKSNGEWDEFIEFCDPWLKEITITQPAVKPRDGKVYLDVFYTENSSPSEKELVWAGDGMQIWLQILLHVYHNRGLNSLVLDEPEIFLHADLQRRLVRLLDSYQQQIILATHSSETLAEVSIDSIVWVDKSRRRGIRSPENETLFDMSESLGTSFNLGMAKALRSKGVLFLEGKDVKILRTLGQKLGSTSMSDETSLAVVPIGGYSNWSSAEHFGWMLRDFLQGSVKSMIILDRDYRTEEQVSTDRDKLCRQINKVHVWEKKELESYLIAPPVISRLTGETVEVINEILLEAMDSLRHFVLSRVMSEKTSSERSEKKHSVTISQEALECFEDDWKRIDYRFGICPPKQVLTFVNNKLQSRGKKAVSFMALAKNIQEGEIPSEMKQVIQSIDELCD